MYAFLYLCPVKLIKATYTCLISLNATIYAVFTLATTMQAVRICDNIKIQQEDDLYMCKP